MDWGLLWLDETLKRPMSENVAQAADRYQRKFGRAPNLCYVNAGQMNGETVVGGVRLVAARNVLPYHFWIGCEEVA